MSESKESWETLLAEAVSLHKQGVEGDKEAVKKAYELLTKVRDMVPQNNLVKAYYGSATALLGRDDDDTMEQFRKCKKGLKMLDEVVSEEAENIEIRIVRAFVCLNLPEMYFHRTATAIEDFNYLISRYEEDSTLFSQEFYWKLLYNLGLSYKNLGKNYEADSSWEKLLSKTTDLKYKSLVELEGFHSNIDAGSESSETLNIEEKEIPQEGMELYFRALSGDQKYAKRAFDYFKKALEADPGNKLLNACYADCMSLMGKHTKDASEMFSNAIKAIKIFDKVVTASPGNIMTRFMRAYHSYRLPESFFHRTTTAIEDFEYLIQRYEKDNSVFSKDCYWQLLYDLGLAYQRMEMEEEESSVWEKLLSKNPDTKYKEKINDMQSHSVNPAQYVLWSNKEAFYQEGKRLHAFGVAGNKEAVKRALDVWQQAYQAYPNDPVAHGYYGSSLALMGRDTLNPQKMFSNTFDGISHLNQAIKQDENNIELRIIRAYLFYSLPESFFPLTEMAIEDFEFLRTAYTIDNSIFSQELYHHILNDLGRAYQRVGYGHKH